VERLLPVGPDRVRVKALAVATAARASISAVPSTPAVADVARAERGHPDPLRSQLGVKRLGDREHGALRHRVDAAPRPAAKARHRRGVEDVTRSALEHTRVVRINPSIRKAIDAIEESGWTTIA
jgi:hypothetical protein